MNNQRTAWYRTLLLSTVMAAGFMCLMTEVSVGQTGYYFSVDNIHIDNTRSPHQDSDYASLTVKVGDRLLPQLTSSLGNVNNGDHYPDGLSIYPVPIQDSDKVTFNYIVVNAGHSGTSSDVQKILETAGDKLAGDSYDPSDWKTYVGLLLKGIGLLFADCDGLVAADQITLTGADLRARTAGSSSYSETRSYPGSDSPTFCGSNSQYSVTFSVVRWNWTGPWEVPGGGRTDAAVAAAVFQNKIWLFGKSTDNRIYLNQSADGSTWTGWSEVPGGLLTDTSLAVTESNSRLWLFAKRLDGRIYMNYFDPSITSLRTGGNWYGWDEVAGDGRTDAAPGAAYFSLGGLGNDHVFVFDKGSGTARIYYNQFQVPLPGLTSTGKSGGRAGGPPRLDPGSRDAKLFAGWKELTGGGSTDAGPSAFFGVNPYVLVKGAGRPSVFYNRVTMAPGASSEWGAWHEVFFNYPPDAPLISTSGITTSAGVEFLGQAYVFALASDGNIFYRAGPLEDDTLWKKKRWVPDTYVGTPHAPAAIEQGGMLRVFYVGPDQKIYMNSYGIPEGIELRDESKECADRKACTEGHIRMVKRAASSAPAPQPAPPNSTILVPDSAFQGGLLTGVVIGPDDQPVANTPVEITGGLPATLSGEVVGDPVPCSSNDPKCPDQAPPAPGTVQVKSPLDCAQQLQKAREANVVAAIQPQPTPAPPAANSSAGSAPAGAAPGITTDGAGRFALCMLPDAPAVNVSVPGGGTVSIKAFQDPPSLAKEPPDFFQPGQKVSVIGLVRDPSAQQNGRTWRLPAVQSWSPNGQQVISVFKTPNELKPGPAQISYRGGDGQTRQVQGTVFKIVRAFLDRTQLHSDQGATFEYEVLFLPQSGQNLCVKMHAVGPVSLVREPSPLIPIAANGIGRFEGKIRATGVAPGSTVPFDLRPDIHVCHNDQ